MDMSSVLRNEESLIEDKLVQYTCDNSNFDENRKLKGHTWCLKAEQVA